MITAESTAEKYRSLLKGAKSSLISGIPDDAGENYFTPHELLCASLAACLEITAEMILDRLKLAYEKVTVKVELDREGDARTVFRYSVDISGDIPEETRQFVMAKLKNCPLRKILSGEIAFTE